MPLKTFVSSGRGCKNPCPFISYGFTAGIKGRIGVPEFTITRGLGVPIEEGTEIWKITRDGKQTLYAVFENKTFKIVDQ